MDKPNIALNRYATEHFKAFKILKDNTKSDTDLMYIKYYLLCRCLELCFKEHIVFNGICPFEDLANKYGHNLLVLMNDAESINYIDINSQEETIVKVLNNYYNSKEFEYPKTGLKTFPVIEDVEELCNRLVWL